MSTTQAACPRCNVQYAISGDASGLFCPGCRQPLAVVSPAAAPTVAPAVDPLWDELPAGPTGAASRAAGSRPARRSSSGKQGFNPLLAAGVGGGAAALVLGVVWFFVIGMNGSIDAAPTAAAPAEDPPLTTPVNDRLKALLARRAELLAAEKQIARRFQTTGAHNTYKTGQELEVIRAELRKLAAEEPELQQAAVLETQQNAEHERQRRLKRLEASPGAKVSP